MPPRHGKSELISKYAPAWFLGNFPHRKVMLASYNDLFAASWGRKAREVLKEEQDLFGIGLNPLTTGGGNWELQFTKEGRNAQGIMVTGGVGGGLTGKGAHLLIIDDPIKNAEEAQSAATREAHWEWWLSTVRTRLQKGAGVILVMTRWHEDDLAGRFLANDPHRDKHGNVLPDGVRREDVEGDEWDVLNLPGFAEAPDVPEHVMESWGEIDDVAFQAACDEWKADWRDDIGRRDGEVLWPEMFDGPWMEQTRRAQGVYWFSAMYQQRPSPASGLHFKRDTFQYYERTLAEGAAEAVYQLYRHDGTVELIGETYMRKFQTADCAASEDQNADYTVVSTWGVTPRSDVLLLNVDRQRRDTTRMPGFIKSCFHAAGNILFLGIERLGHGLNAIQALLNEGLPIVKLEADKDKLSRSIPAQVLYSNHKVFHPKHAHYLADFEDELLKFPNGKNDDQVDTVSYMAIKLPTLGSAAQPRSGNRDTQRPGVPERQHARRARRGKPLTGGVRNREF